MASFEQLVRRNLLCIDEYIQIHPTLPIDAVILCCDGAFVGQFSDESEEDFTSFVMKAWDLIFNNAKIVTLFHQEENNCYSIVINKDSADPRLWEDTKQTHDSLYATALTTHPFLANEDYCALMVDGTFEDTFRVNSLEFAQCAFEKLMVRKTFLSVYKGPNVQGVHFFSG